MGEIKEIVRIFTPQMVIDAYHKVRDSIRNSSTFMAWRYKYDRVRYYFILRRLRRKVKSRPLNVLFLTISHQGWKYDSLYRLMDEDKNFSPQILVCPTVNRGYNEMVKLLDETYCYFSTKNYDVALAYNKGSNEYTDIRKFHPDIIFHTSPYKGQIDSRYYINRIKHALTCYLSYGIEINPFDWCYALELHQRVWKHFIGIQNDIKIIKKYCPWAVSNRVVTGYPTYEVITKGSADANAWKNKDNNYKRIIYAPHHTIEGNTGLLHFSTFLEYGEFILELAKKYKDKVQFVFKPHPLLRFNLENHPAWGKERTDAYYRQWEESENTNFVNGIYVDLFNSSDAMIHDCASFMYEYMCTQKPVMFLANAVDKGQYNDLGMVLYESHYKAKTKEDIIRFIEDVVLNGQDVMKPQRMKIFQEYVLPPNGCTAAENILNEIKKELRI